MSTFLVILILGGAMYFLVSKHTHQTKNIGSEGCNGSWTE